MIGSVWRRVVLRVLWGTLFAVPAAAQDDGVSAPPSAAHAQTAAGTTVTQRHPLFPPPCLACAAQPSIFTSRSSERGATESVLGGAELPQGVAPVIGGVVGAVVGLVAARLYCANRSCEMTDLVGPLVGALLGYTVGKQIEGSFPWEGYRKQR